MPGAETDIPILPLASHAPAAAVSHAEAARRLQAQSARWLQTQSARKTLDDAAAAARLLGGVFVALGVTLVFPALQGRMRAGMQALAVANALVLVGPGAWYVLAAALICRLDRRAATVALRVAAAQGALVAAGLGLAYFFDRRDARLGASTPALLAIYFMPALAALCYYLRRAREAMNLLGGGEAGFEALAPRPVIPLEPPPAMADAPPAPPPHGSDSLRVK